MFKKIASTTTLIAALLFPSKAEAKDIKIELKLQYDYSEHTQDSAFSEEAPNKGLYHDLIVNADSYNDFIADAQQAGLLKKEKIELASFLAGVAGRNYDNSMPFKQVNFEELFSAAQDTLTTGAITPAGAICGGIHYQTKEALQELGIKARTYSGRSRDDGAGHIFAIAHGDDGFISISYDEIMHTRTHDFYRSLEIAQKLQGKSDFDMRIFDHGQEFRRITRDGKKFFEFTGMKPETDVLLDTMLYAPKGSEEGLHGVIGNGELSGSGILGIGPFELGAKIGRIYGQDPSALRHADLFQGTIRLWAVKDDAYVNTNIGVIYGILDEVAGHENKVFLVSDMQVGGQWDFGKDWKWGLRARIFGAGDIGVSLKESAPLLTVFDPSGALFLSHKDGFIAYTAMQGMIGHNNEREQKPAVYLGDVIVGMAAGNFVRPRIEYAFRPTAHEVGVGIDVGPLRSMIRRGWGRQEVFTPDYVQASFSGTYDFNEHFGIDAGIEYVFEDWSHGETDQEGSGRIQARVSF